jgi:hypothetical protein
MGTLVNKTPATTFKDLLTVNASVDGEGIEAGLKTIYDGEGVASAAEISASDVNVSTHNGSSTGLKLNGTLVTSTAANLNSISAITSVDTDISSVSSSDDTLASAKAIKSYVDTTITGQDMDVAGDSGTIDVDLDSETLTIAGGSGITTSGSSTTITVAGDNASTSAKGVASFNSAHFSVSSGAVSIGTDMIDDTLVDWGTGSNQVNTDDVPEGSTNLWYTNERVDDRVGAIATAGEGMDVTYNDSSATLTFAAEDASDSNKGAASFNATDFSVSSGAVTLQAERIQDLAGGMFTSNTETNITATYQDGDGTIDLVVVDASTSAKGAASFASADFAVSSGAVSIATGGVSSDQLAGSVANAKLANSQITVSAGSNLTGGGAVALGGSTTINAAAIETTTSATFQIDSGNSGVKIKNNSGVLEVKNAADSAYADLKVANLEVSGATTTISSETLTIADNQIVLNSNVTGTPSENAGILIERGSSTNSSVLWDESSDSWKVGVAGSELEVTTISGTQTLTNKTLTSPGINAGTVDGITSLTVGTDGSGSDVYFYSGTSGDHVFYDASEELLTITGTDGAQALKIADGDLVVVDKIYIYDNDGGEYISGNGSAATLTGAWNSANMSITGGAVSGITDLAVADGGTGASTASAARTNLGLVIGTNVLAQQTVGIADDNLVEVDGSPANNDFAKFTTAGLEGRSYTETRTDLGLVIGTNVQAYDAQLADVAGLAVSVGNFIVGDGSNFVAESGATARASLGLTIGTHVQAYDAGLTSIAGLTTAADKMIYTSGSDTYAVAALTSFARTILDDANAAAALTTLGAASSGDATALAIALG